MSLVRRLRASICDTFLEVGPLAPTLCEGWQAQDLAAHLWIRERKPSALPGIGLERFSDATARIQVESLHTNGFHKLVEDLRKPFGLGWLAPVTLTEYAVHHIDLSRANDLDVEFSDADERKLWTTTSMLLRALGKRFGGRLVVTPTVGRSLTIGSGNRPVHLQGAPSELLYFASGRVDDAYVGATGEPEAISQVREAALRL